MAAAATMAAAARELMLRAGTSDMEEEEGPLVRTRDYFSCGVLSGGPSVRKAWAGFRRRVGGAAATGDATCVAFHIPPWDQA